MFGLTLLHSVSNVNRCTSLVMEDLLSVHQFIKQLKEEKNGNLDEFRRFQAVATKSLTADDSHAAIPENESPIQKFIHGDIFEYAVQKAAGCQVQKDNPWPKFRELYPNIKTRQIKLYSEFMDNAGINAWGIFQSNVRKLYGRKSKSIQYSFGHHIQNYETFPFLTKKLEADVFVSSSPFVVCDIKYSTMKREAYESDYLVHALIQVLIYSLALDLDPANLHLRVLVFYSKNAEAVLYKSDLHAHIVLVNSLRKRLQANSPGLLKTNNSLKYKAQEIEPNENVEKRCKGPRRKTKKYQDREKRSSLANKCEFTDDEEVDVNYTYPVSNK